MSKNVAPSPPKPWEKAGSGGAAQVKPSAMVADSPDSAVVAPTPEDATKTEATVSTVVPQTQTQNTALNSTLPVTQTVNNTMQNNGMGQYSRFGNNMYGNNGYNTGYGGGMYNGFGGYGGMGGMGMAQYGPYGSAGMPLSNMGMFLGNLQHATQSIAQLGELLGMNVDALGYAILLGASLVERGGRGMLQVLNFLTGRVDLTQFPTVDPNTGQALVVPTEEEVLEERKQKTKHWLIGFIAMFVGWQVLKRLVAFVFRKRLTAGDVMEKAWNTVSGLEKTQSPGLLQNALSMNNAPPMGMGMRSQLGYGGYGGYGNNYGYGGYNPGGVGGYGGPGMFNYGGQFY